MVSHFSQNLLICEDLITIKFMSKTLVKKIKKHGYSPLISFLPSIVTLTSLCIALSAIRFAIHGDFFKASAFLLFAGFMDGVDGRLARFLNLESDFGAQLDSLVDFVNFGVVPGFVIYSWISYSHEVKFFNWAMVLFFAICAAIRLARFNVDLKNNYEANPILEKYFFKGLPAPVGAGMSLLPMIITYEFGAGFYSNPYFVLSYVTLIALFMASVIPTISIKKIPIRNDYAYLTLVILTTIIIGLLIKPWLTIAIIGIVYTLSIPLTIFAYIYIRSKQS